MNNRSLASVGVRFMFLARMNAVTIGSMSRKAMNLPVRSANGKIAPMDPIAAGRTHRLGKGTFRVVRVASTPWSFLGSSEIAIMPNGAVSWNGVRRNNRQS